ncbi:MAG: Rieske 2Fe-2S domain-containing protein [Actinobacteria bacterium]|nr:MAG: Rieske 2Fe-2S domain-containing protein [Actinomycetota bacterium]
MAEVSRSGGPLEPEVSRSGGPLGPEVSRRRARAESRATAFFTLSTAAALALVVVYLRGGQPQLEGTLLAVITGGIGAAIVSWAKHAMPNDEVVEHRAPIASSVEDVAALAADFERGAEGIGRRRTLILAASASFVAFGAALLFPLRSLGPRPGKGLKSTPYAEGPMRVVTADGLAVKPADLALDGVITVWPEGHTDAADAPTLLIRTRADQTIKPRTGRDDWTIDGIVAYSKLCTHVGCPVGLYQAKVGLLLCPCHQSTFDVLDGARPVFGPAARSLPQLPLGLNAAGEIIARADFSSPVGPGFWDRDR